MFYYDRHAREHARRDHVAPVCRLNTPATVPTAQRGHRAVFFLITALPLLTGSWPTCLGRTGGEGQLAKRPLESGKFRDRHIVLSYRRRRKYAGHVGPRV